MWRQLVGKGLIPTARSSHASASYKNNIYVVGGEQEPRIPLPINVHKFDVTNQEWTKLETENDPIPRVAGSTVVINDKLYLYGGRTGIQMGDGDIKDLSCLNLRTQKWETVGSSGDIPEGRSYHGMVTCNGKIYIFGGCTAQGRTNDLYCFDPANNKWEKLLVHEAVTPRGGPGLVSVEDKVFVIGGFNGKEETDDMYEYDTVTRDWSVLTPSPNIPPISVFAVSSIGSKIILFGGEVSPSAAGHAGAGGFTNDVYVYDVNERSKGWQKIQSSGDLPSKRGWLPATALDNKFYIFGGNTNSNDRVDDLFAFSIN